MPRPSAVRADARGLLVSVDLDLDGVHLPIERRPHPGPDRVGIVLHEVTRAEIERGVVAGDHAFVIAQEATIVDALLLRVPIQHRGGDGDLLGESDAVPHAEADTAVPKLVRAELSTDGDGAEILAGPGQVL